MDLTLIDTAGYEDVTDDSLEARMREQTELAVEDGRPDPVHDGRPRGRDVAGPDLRRRPAPASTSRSSCWPTSPRAARAAAASARPIAWASASRSPSRPSTARAWPICTPPWSRASADIFIEEIDEPDKPIRIAIIGRPNAGKSTLINRLIGEDRMLTGPEAGITRDSISVDWEYEGQNIRLVDTAGMRRKARVQEKLEKLSVADTIRAITFAEVVVLVMDKDDAFDDPGPAAGRSGRARGPGPGLCRRQMGPGRGPAGQAGRADASWPRTSCRS